MTSYLTGARIGIRHLCDWALFLNSIEEKEFLKLFQEPLQNMGLWVFAQTISLTSAQAFGLKRQNWMGSALYQTCVSCSDEKKGKNKLF